MEQYTPDPIHLWKARYHAARDEATAKPIQVTYDQGNGCTHTYSFRLRALPGAEEYLGVYLYNRAWAVGAQQIHVACDRRLFEAIRGDFDCNGRYAGLREMMERVYGGFQLCWEAGAAKDSETGRQRGQHKSRGILETPRPDPYCGRHIGVDLGGTDLKVVALRDGEILFYAKQTWNPRTYQDPEDHLGFIERWICRAKQQVGFRELDGIGISTAGIVVGAEVKISGLGAGLSQQQYQDTFCQMAAHLSHRFEDVPVQVMHDGDAAALWVAVDMGLTNVLGLAFGTGLGAGYVDVNGQLTGALCEIGKCILDMAPDAPEHIYNHTHGPALHYLSQNAVFRLAPRHGISLDSIPERAEKLKHVQQLAEEGNRSARSIFQYIGRRLAMAIVEFYDYFGMDRVVLFGRVASGLSGEWILASAEETLMREFPQNKVQLYLPYTPEDKDPAVTREFGQAIAAAYLSSMRLSGSAGIFEISS